MTDDELTSALSPVELVAYLRAHGWQEGSNDEKTATWTSPSDAGDPFEILVPLNRDLRGFNRLARDLLHTLEVAEGRPAAAIRDDMVLVSADVIRAISKRGSDGSETIPFTDGPRMLSDLNEMFLAAACSAVSPRPVYHSRKAKKALDYMKGLQLGQTERGSYVLRVISPVAPEMTSKSRLLNETHGASIPFERQVVAILAGALEIARTAAIRAVSTGKMDVFEENIEKGISANLCRSLGALGEDSSVRTLGLSVNWAASRPVPGSLGRPIVFERELLAAVSEAGRVLRETIPEPDFELHGHVIRLDKFPDDKSGIVQVMAFIEHSYAYRRVAIELSGVDYQTAIKAHAEGKQVTCVGELKKEGRTHSLVNPIGFRFDSESELEESE